MMTYGYPVFLDLAGRACVVIGAGPLAEEKVHGLRAAGAEVRWLERSYEPGDLAGCFLAVAADMDRSRNAAIYAEALSRNVLLNCLDDPPHCQFIYPSIHRQGDLVVAISTTGRCPALAVRLRQDLATRLGPEYAEFLRIMGGLRERIARLLPDFAARKALWYRLVDSPAISLLREGHVERAQSELERILAAPEPERNSQ
jgi:siroheme synthase-like protein